MSKGTLLDKVWDCHRVRGLPGGADQLLIGTHLIHEVTSPQAFAMLRERGLRVRFPKRTFATADHIIPTTSLNRPFADGQAEAMMQALLDNCRDFDVEFLGGARQGVVHIIGPELGLTQPGMTIACGDSHTATHGAFGSVAFGIGTTEVANVLATGCLVQQKPKVRRIQLDGVLPPSVYAKDVILYIIWRLGAGGGTGYAYEYAGDIITNMDMAGRMTVCNMSVEGGAKLGYCAPDDKTFAWMKGRERAPKGDAFERLIPWWESLVSDPDAEYDDVVVYNGADIPSMVTWGTNSGQAMPIDGNIPNDANVEALRYMGFNPGQQLLGTPINAAFMGSCTNGRVEDFREAARLIQEYDLRVAQGVQAIAVPGSAAVLKQLVSERIDKIFKDAGWDFRNFGCSACLGMNPDTFKPKEVVVSTSNRNYEGRQGKGVRTLLMSPAAVVYSASKGVVADPRNMQFVEVSS